MKENAVFDGVGKNTFHKSRVLKDTWMMMFGNASGHDPVNVLRTFNLKDCI